MTFVIDKQCGSLKIAYFEQIFNTMQPFILMVCLENVLSK
jgi:hypothetical protein